MQATFTIRPIITSLTVTQKKLDLNTEEMRDHIALKQYIQDYHTPYWFEVVDVLVDE
jgi:hypothetical protein